MTNDDPRAVDPDSPRQDEAALLVRVPEAEPVVGRWRDQLDWAARYGVPAHVTVLYPFLPPADITPTTLATVAAAVIRVPRFDCAFREVRWFGEEVVWLAPDAEAMFRALTDLVTDAFPQCPPYNGAFDDVQPHLTVADQRGRRGELRAAAAAVAEHLPVTTRVSHVDLMVGGPRVGSWRTLATFPLAEAQADSGGS